VYHWRCDAGGSLHGRRYLAGVLDFTGELNRFAVARATARDVGAVLRARDVVDALQGQFLQMDLRNGALR
jgi:predicted translin family RNA/ssDNA-binding protein